MGWFRNDAGRARQAAPWEGPFAPPAPSGQPKFDPMVRTAAELVATHEEAPASRPKVEASEAA